MSSSDLDEAGAETALTSYSTAFSVQANTAGKVLVIGSFSTSKNVKSGYGEWHLSNGTEASLDLKRSLNTQSDKGIASVVHVFTNVTAGSQINLQHRSSGEGTLKTFGGNLVAIPLSVSTGEDLNYGLYQQSQEFKTNSTTFTATDIKTSVQLDRSSDNGMYIATSFNAKSLTNPETATWQLQYRKVGDADWIDTGNEMTRTMSSPSDEGAITLYALEEGLDAGEYEVQLLVKSTTGETVDTLNGTIAAVALSYTNATGGGYFDGFAVQDNALNRGDGTDLSAYTNLQASLSFLNSTNTIFSAMSFVSSAGSGANQTGKFSLFVTNAVGNLQNQENHRFFSGATSKGSGASVGLFSITNAYDITIFGQGSNLSGPISTSSATLVGFSTESIPEAATVTLIALSGITMVGGRRSIKSKRFHEWVDAYMRKRKMKNGRTTAVSSKNTAENRIQFFQQQKVDIPLQDRLGESAYERHSMREE
ncbi:MAG TPA: hypothetical protein VIR63_00640 [Pontiella sp.]